MRSRVENLAEIFTILSSFFLTFPYISRGKNSHATTNTTEKEGKREVEAEEELNRG